MSQAATGRPKARPGPEEFVRGLGANGVVDYTGDLAAAVASIAPDGVSAVAHTAGDAAALGALVRTGGRLASVVGATAEQVGREDVTVIPVLATDTSEKLRALLDAVADSRLQVPVAQTFPLEDGAAAIEAFGQHKLESSSSPSHDPPRPAPATS